MHATKTLLLLTSCALCIASAQTARADYFGLEVVERSDLEICKEDDPNLPFKLNICEVFVVLDQPTDRLISMAFTNVSTTDPQGFFQHTLGGNTAPPCAFISLYPTLVCDSFVSLGVDCFDLIDGTTTDPDFDFTAFNTSGTVSGGWFNSAPSSGQGDPDANGRVLIARFSYKQNKTTSGDVCVFAQFEGSKDVVAFLLEPFDCSVPGMQGGTGATGSGTIWYVDDDGAAGNGCTNWGDACPDLQTALGAADPLGGDQIWVAAGTYAPAGPAGNRGATFQLIDDTAVYGGFFGTPGTEGVFNARDPDPATNGTTLTGDLNGDDQTGGDNSENSYHVVTGSGTGETTVLDGLTITAGNADAQMGPGFCFEDVPGAPCTEDGDCISGPCVHQDDIGAGMIVVGGSPTVSNCTFSGNRAQSAGGGMYNGSSGLTITRCTFSSNEIADLLDGGAGGMCNNFGSTSKVRNCTFSGNSAAHAGGMGNLNGSTPEVSACIFTSNVARLGGGMYSNDSSPIVRDTTFNKNIASYGGGLFDSDQSSSKLFNCTFTGNAVVNAGGGMFVWAESTLEVTNSRFSGNSAGLHGGGILVWLDGTVTVTNCTFSRNVCDVVGGGMKLDGGGSTSTVTNCVFWENQDDLDGSTGGPFTDESAQIHVGGSNFLAVTYTDIQQLVEGGSYDSGTNVANIDADPLFVRMPSPGPDEMWGTDDDDFGDLHLTAGSPCIDAADNVAVPADLADLNDNGDLLEPTPMDLDLLRRFVDDLAAENVGNDSPEYLNTWVDMGAYEFNPCPWDFDDDGSVGAFDLAQLLGAWGTSTCPPYPDPDFSLDCDVGPFDLAVLLGNWGSCP